MSSNVSNRSNSSITIEQHVILSHHDARIQSFMVFRGRMRRRRKMLLKRVFKARFRIYVYIHEENGYTMRARAVSIVCAHHRFLLRTLDILHHKMKSSHKLTNSQIPKLYNQFNHEFAAADWPKQRSCCLAQKAGFQRRYALLQRCIDSSSSATEDGISPAWIAFYLWCRIWLSGSIHASLRSKTHQNPCIQRWWWW